MSAVLRCYPPSIANARRHRSLTDPSATPSPSLDMMTLVNEKTDKATVGSKAAKIETHPERRFKAAFEAYKEEQMPIIRKDFPGLRLQQYHDRLYKDFQKHPDNPFNQVSMDYNASKEEKVAALDAMRAQTEAR